MKFYLGLIMWLAFLPTSHGAGGNWYWEGGDVTLSQAGIIERESAKIRQSMIVLTTNGSINESGKCFEIFLERDNKVEIPLIYCEKSQRPPLGGVVWVYDEESKGTMKMKCVKNCGKGVPNILTYNPGDSGED